MQQRIKSRAFTRATALASVTLLAAALTACGGGGGSNGGGGTPTATVTSISVNATRYYNPATVTINGTGLDSTLAVSSSACTGMALQAGSTATTATYTCTVSGALTGTVIAKSNGTQVGQSSAFTVPQPIVRFAVNNGLSAVGNIDITLAADKVPKTVSNFLAYVNYSATPGTSWYAGTVIHRIVDGFVVQGGGYTAPITDPSTATLKTGLLTAITYEKGGPSNTAGTIAMAADLNGSETSQYFFNTVDNTPLDGKYTAFGSITAGASVLQAVIAAPRICHNVVINGVSETDCLPNPNVVINSATQIQ